MSDSVRNDLRKVVEEFNHTKDRYLRNRRDRNFIQVARPEFGWYNWEIFRLEKEKVLA